jgi:hypothetical protein
LSTETLVLGCKLGAGTATLVNSLVLSAYRLGSTARPRDGGSVSKVGVDTNKIRGNAERTNVLDDNLAGRLG